MYHDEWLDQAKAVPVGQKRRVRHGAESTKAMDVWNNNDSWSVYCHRCHESSKVYKQFLEKPDLSVPVFRKYLDYSACITLQELAVAHPLKYRATIVLLQSKGVSTTILRSLNPMYCLTDDRLVFRFNGVDIGRDATGRSPVKWLKYYQDNSKGFVYLKGTNTQNVCKVVVLCEDLFSCAKVTWYTGYSTMCLLGTRFEDQKVHFILNNQLSVLGAFDDDKGGEFGHRTVRGRCNALSIPYYQVPVPRGLDPKDLKPIELKQIIEESYNEIIKLCSGY